MSTSLCKCKPLRFLPKMRETLTAEACGRVGGGVGAPLLKVKRVLFGAPDHDATMRFLEEELRAQQCIESTKWNFNFCTEQMLDPCGPYVWTAATSPMRASNTAAEQPSQRHMVRRVAAAATTDENIDPDANCQQLYFDPSVLPMQAPELPPTTTMNCSNLSVKEEDGVPNVKHHQSLITDYMTSRKRLTSDLITKSSERPIKQRRLHECSS